MSHSLLLSALAVVAEANPVQSPRPDQLAKPDFAAGRQALASLTDVTSFEFDYIEAAGYLEDQALIDHAEMYCQANGEYPALDLELARRAGVQIITDLETLLTEMPEDEIVSFRIAGYRIYSTGGLSFGDAPTDAFRVFHQTNMLGTEVLTALRIQLRTDQPVARKNGARPGTAPTDTDIVDAIALGLGTKASWDGADELEWIADTIAKVRDHPGGHDDNPTAYREEFAAAYGFEPTEDHFLAGYVDDEAWPEHDDEDENEDDKPRVCSFCGVSTELALSSSAAAICQDCRGEAEAITPED